MEETQGVKCAVHETGVCALHDVEVERRKSLQRSTDKSILSLEKSLQGLADKMPGMSRTVYAIFICGALLITMITASFVYTRDVGQHSIDRDSDLAIQLSVLTEKITALAINAARNEGQQTSLLGEMRSFTVTAQKILDKQRETETKGKKDAPRSG